MNKKGKAAKRKQAKKTEKYCNKKKSRGAYNVEIKMGWLDEGEKIL